MFQIRRAKDRRPSNALSVSRLNRLAKREECMMISVLKASGLAMATVMLLGAITLAAESTSTFVEPMDAATIDNLKILYRQLIDAENRHDHGAIRAILWNSQSTLFV